MARKRILVVDDEQIMLDFVASLLRAAGYRVTTAMEGAAALRAARAERPDLAVVDLLMPGIDGYAFCSMVRRDRALGFPIIVVSGRVGKNDAQRAVDSGAAAFLAKPIDRRQLLETVKQLLEAPP